MKRSFILLLIVVPLLVILNNAFGCPLCEIESCSSSKNTTVRCCCPYCNGQMLKTQHKVYQTPLFRFSKDNKQHFYLLGTYHNLEPPYLRKFADKLVEVVAASDVILFENTESLETYSREKFEEMGAFRKPDENGLSSFSPEVQSKIRPLIEASLQTRGVPFTAEELSIKSLIFIVHHDHVSPSTNGSDIWLQKISKRNHKKIGGLETCLNLKNYYATDPYALERLARQLKTPTPQIIQEKEEQQKRITTRYLQNNSLLDLFGVKSEYITESSTKERNIKWFSRIKTYYDLYTFQNKKNTLFFVVGWAHLCNKYGLINLLLRLGFTVERMNSDGTWISWKRWDQQLFL